MIFPYDIAGSIEIEGLHARGVELLRRTFVCTNPKWRQAKAMGIDTEEPEFVEYFREMPTGKIHVPRGGLERAKTVLGNEGMTLALRDDRRSSGAPLDPTQGRAELVSLRDYQAIGMRAVVTNESGLLVLPPGCGKTRLGIGIVQALGRHALIMVPTKDLAKQWKDQVWELLGREAGILSGDFEETEKEIVVALESSLLHKLQRDPEWAIRFGLFLDDECHRSACLTIQACADRIPARHRAGMSATPDRDDGQGSAVEWTFGPRLLERTTAEMVKAGYLMQVTVETEETFYLGVEKPAGLSDQKYRIRLERDLTENVARNARIVLRAVRETAFRHTILILTGRKEHVYALVTHLNEVGIRAEGLTSASAWKKRVKVVEGFREGSIPILVATSLADQGLDIPRLSRVYLAFPYRSKTMTTQRAGRVMRIFEMKKDAIVVDFFDCNVPTLDSRAKDRLRLYKRLGLTIV